MTEPSKAALEIARRFGWGNASETEVGDHAWNIDALLQAERTKARSEALEEVRDRIDNFADTLADNKDTQEGVCCALRIVIRALKEGGA